MTWISTPSTDAYWLCNASVPGVLLADIAEGDGLVRMDFKIEGGAIAAIVKAGAAKDSSLPADDLDGGLVFPCFVDLHTHLDKSHILPRCESREGDLFAAIAASAADKNNFSEADLEQRMEFSLQCAYAHGTRALRTHLDCSPDLSHDPWPVFERLRERWRARIELQAVSLTTLDCFADDGYARNLAQTVARHGGVLGAFCYKQAGMERLLARVFTLAAEFGLDLDLHVDEGLDPDAAGLETIARIALAVEFPGRVVCGHCCSLSVQLPGHVARTLELVAEAGFTVVSLPLTNLFLQDRGEGRTPRLRGMTLIRELAAHGVPVALASDNCRDPFFAYGDLDMLEVFNMGARIAHLEQPVRHWIQSITATPAQAMGLAEGGLGVGRSADLVLFRARNDSELLSRPQSERVVIRAGEWIDTTVPDFRQLDSLY